MNGIDILSIQVNIATEWMQDLFDGKSISVQVIARRHQINDYLNQS